MGLERRGGLLPDGAFRKTVFGRFPPPDQKNGINASRKRTRQEKQGGPLPGLLLLPWHWSMLPGQTYNLSRLVETTVVGDGRCSKHPNVIHLLRSPQERKEHLPC